MRNSAMPAEKREIGIYDADPDVVPGRDKPELKIVRKRKTGTRIKAVLWVALIFAAFFIVTSRYSHLTKLNYEIADLKGRLEEQNSINSALEVELDKKTNIMMVRSAAETELGMHEPDNHQIIYIDVPRANKITVSDENESGFGETIGLLEYIKAFIGIN